MWYNVMVSEEKDPINPEHYRHAGETYETIRVIEAWNLNYHLGNATKYISRAGKKHAHTYTEDLSKAVWYLQREIKRQDGET